MTIFEKGHRRAGIEVRSPAVIGHFSDWQGLSSIPMRGCSGWALVMGVAGTLALAGAGCGGRARPGGTGGAGATTAARPGSSPSPAPSPASSPGPVVAPVALPEPPDVVALAAGASHTCALLASGRVSCWGASGRLGDVSALRGRVSDRVRWSVPALVSGVTDAVAIDAEAGRTCVVTRTGAPRGTARHAAGNRPPATPRPPAPGVRESRCRAR